LAAGGSHSAAITENGDVYTFGDGGRGQLGLGIISASFQPSRVESLVGSASVHHAALGDHQSLFLDSTGTIHACGTSPETTAGGADTDAAADLQSLFNGGPHRTGLDGSKKRGFTVAQSFSRRSRGRGTAASGLGDAVAAASRSFSPGHPSGSFLSWEAMQLVPIINHSTRSMELQQSILLYDDEMHNSIATDSAGAAWEAAFTPSTVLGGGQGKRPIQFALPARLLDGATTHSFKSIACCSHYGSGVALSTHGVPFTILPRIGSALRHASHQVLRPPSPLLTSTLDRCGGATAVAAGSGFCAALTGSGNVIAWSVADIDSLPAVDEDEEKQVSAPLPRIGTLRASGLTTILEISLCGNEEKLPAMKEIVAAPEALLMSDGRSVWVLRIVPRLPGPAAVAQHGTFCDTDLRLEKILDVGDDSVASMAAGGRAAAVVTSSGYLWLWGTVLSLEDCKKEVERAADGSGHWAFSTTSTTFDSTTESRFGGPGEGSWVGLHSRLPAIVPGLHRVKKVALGCGHALAEVAA